MRGSRRTAAWATMAGVGWFNGGEWAADSGRKKGSAVNRAALLSGRLDAAAYLEAAPVVLPKRLRNFSTRPPMLSTDFWVPV